MAWYLLCLGRRLSRPPRGVRGPSWRRTGDEGRRGRGDAGQLRDAGRGGRGREGEGWQQCFFRLSSACM